MDHDQFKDVFEEQVSTCSSVLIVKAEEYVTASDRLSNFKTSAELQGCTPAQALGGYMAKHTISIYDMIESGQTYSKAKWNEKITDHINYLILLKAILVEEDEKIHNARSVALETDSHA